VSTIPLGLSLGWGLLLAVPLVALVWLAIQGWQSIGRQHLATLLAGGLSNAAFVGGALTATSIAVGSVWGIYWGVTAALLAALAALVTPALTVGVGLVRLALAERDDPFSAWDEAEEVTTLHNAPVFAETPPPRRPVGRPVDAPPQTPSPPAERRSVTEAPAQDRSNHLRVDTLTIPTIAFTSAWTEDELRRAWPQDVTTPPVQAESESGSQDRIWGFRGKGEI